MFVIFICSTLFNSYIFANSTKIINRTNEINSTMNHNKVQDSFKFENFEIESNKTPNTIYVIKEPVEKGLTKSEIICYILSLLATLLSIYATLKASKNETNIKKQDIKMKTANLLISKRIEVYPKLHILTDQLGASIRYTNNHNDYSKIKGDIKKFYNGLAVWDAKYCIFATNNLTNEISILRKSLEKEIDRLEKDLSKKDLVSIYESLVNIEKALKTEMGIFYNDFENLMK